MTNLNVNLFNKFSHLYIEKDAYDYSLTNKIIGIFKKSNIVTVNHYKEVFCRSHQDFALQKNYPNIILAVKKDNFIYKGAPVCENFGHENFYYTSSVMNCLYNCEYCYLQGMYPSANIVIFVNIEDFINDVDKLLIKIPVYICISYDTDLMALEKITGFIKSWLDFASTRINLTIELRTKSAFYKTISSYKAIENFILAWTLSPQDIIDKYEYLTPSLDARLNAIKKAINDGWNVRLCFDPILYIKDWENVYDRFFNKVFKVIPSDKLFDVSAGVFRVSKEYLKKMRKINPMSQILSYPFESINGVSTYKAADLIKIKNYIKDKLESIIGKEKIFIRIDD